MNSLLFYVGWILKGLEHVTEEEKEQKISSFPDDNSSWAERERMHIAMGFVESKEFNIDYFRQ